jgi:hypothetical protein
MGEKMIDNFSGDGKIRINTVKHAHVPFRGHEKGFIDQSTPGASARRCEGV